MKSSCRISMIVLPEFMREKAEARFQVGQVQDISIKGTASFNDSWALFPLDVSVTVKEGRRLPQLAAYWWVMAWLEQNTPEDIEKRFGIFSKDVWHEHLKGCYGISSVAFGNLDHEKMNAYMDFVKNWIRARFDVSIEDVIEYMSGHGT